MLILAIDTALTACAAAVFDTDTDELRGSESLAMERGHAEALLPLVARVMDSAGAEFGDLDRIAVTVGPGSFTGLRVGISAARGIALAASKVAVGVSTLAAFAAPCIAEDLADRTLAAIDARHGHLYAQGFGEGGRTLMPAAYIRIEDAVTRLDGEVHLAGSASGVLAERWPAGAPKPILLRTSLVPEIAWVARLAAAADPAQAPATPLYLRLPDAKPQKAELAQQ